MAGEALRCENPTCGKPMPARRKLKTFCSYACRGQHNALKAISGPSELIGAKNTKQSKALRRLKRQSVSGFSFVRINSCIYRLDRPRARCRHRAVYGRAPDGTRLKERRVAAHRSTMCRRPSTLQCCTEPSAAGYPADSGASPDFRQRDGN